LCAGVAFAPAFGQQADGRAGLTVTPSLSVTQTLTDHHLSGAGTPKSESITTISPGVRVSSRSGRVQGTLDYGLVGVLYGRDSKESSVQQRLATAGRAELIPNHLDLNASASIARQAISALGPQAVDGSLTEINQSEVRSYNVQPTLRGVWAGLVGVQASLTASGTDSDAQTSSSGSGANLTLTSVPAGARFGWSVTGQRQISDFEGGRETTTDRVIASLQYQPQPEWQMVLRGGAERADLASVEQRRYDNWGAELNWTPGPRTSVRTSFDRRAFGDAHNVAFEHRARRSVWRYVDSRSVADGSGQNSGARLSAYQLFFDLFASQEPDPARRDVLVRSFLERNNIAPETLIAGGFLGSAASVQRRQEVSFALNGVRSSVVAAAFLTDSRRIDTVSSADDDLADGPLRQRGLSVTVSHRITPRQSLNLLMSTQRSRSDGAARRSGLDSVALSWSTQLTERANLSLSLRHSEYDETTQPYTENALTAAFATRF
jgi:uncharacterized protein (PEP-CTERM system associated)